MEVNLIPVFADTEPDSVNLSARTIEEKITDRTRAIICVHKTGILCDMDPIMALAERRGLFVMEDVCQATFGTYKDRLAGTLGHAAAFSFDAEKTVGSDIGGCLVTDDDAFAEHARFMGHSRGAVMKPPFGRVHTHPGFAHRMPQVSAAVTLAQLEIADENVRQRDQMIRLLMELLGQISGIIPIDIPDYVGVYSCWMASFRIDPAQFRCDTDEFGRQCEEAGIPGIGTGRYYLMPGALPFLETKAREGTFPYSQPPASRTYHYSADRCPNAQAYLDTFLRWATFCEKYTPSTASRPPTSCAKSPTATGPDALNR